MSELARLIDMFRVFPRIVLIVYVIGLIVSVKWYLGYEVKPEIRCDAAVMQTVLTNGGSIKDAELLACRQVGVIGRPAGYTALISTLVGAGAVMFGFYTNSGWKWVSVKRKNEE